MATKRAKSVARKTAEKRPRKKPPEIPPTVSVELQLPSPIRGLLPTPPEVAALVERECQRLPMTPEARLRVTNDFNLQYYFGGHTVAYRPTPEGVQVEAVGWEEIGRLRRKLPYRQYQGIVIGNPESWW